MYIYKDIDFFQKLGKALPPGHLYNKIMKFLDPTRRFFLQKLSYKDIGFFQKLGMALPPGHLYNKIMKFLDPTRRFFCKNCPIKTLIFFKNWEWLCPLVVYITKL